MKALRPVLLGCLVVATLCSCGRGGERSITAADLRGHVEFLASDRLAGRATGSEQIRLAEEYVAEAFQSIGLQPIPLRESFFLDYSIYSRTFDAADTFVTVDGIDGSMVSGQAGMDFRPFTFSDQGYAETELVFAGYGITAPEYDYDDYEGIDAAGKIVLIMRYEPNKTDPESEFAGTSLTNHAYFTSKADNARAHGAVGMLLFTTPLHHPADEDLRIQPSYRLTTEELDAPPPSDKDAVFLALHITQDLAQRIVAPSGRSIEELQRLVDEGCPAGTLAVTAPRVRLSVGLAAELRTIEARNVAGYLEGRRVHEIVVIGAHHDHLGSFSGTGDTIYNGADDNASGVAAVLELAEAFASRRSPPEYSMVFATFSGEEWYLLGSSAMVRFNQVPVDGVVFMLNLDMIGRNPEEPVQIYGVPTSPGLSSILDNANAQIDLPLTIHQQPSMGSDHDAFRRRGIPYLFLFTGTHEDYHGVDDEADRLSYARMETITRLAWGILESWE